MRFKKHVKSDQGDQPNEKDQRMYQVVINHEEQYSVWSLDWEPPAGWKAEGKIGTRQDCLDYIEEVWTDMRPLSLRNKTSEPDQEDNDF